MLSACDNNNNFNNVCTFPCSTQPLWMDYHFSSRQYCVKKKLLILRHAIVERVKSIRFSHCTIEYHNEMWQNENIIILVGRVTTLTCLFHSFHRERLSQTYVSCNLNRDYEISWKHGLLYSKYILHVAFHFDCINTCSI